MSQIELKGIGKMFTVSKRPEGKFGMLRGAFVREKTVINALDNISFNINEGELVGYIGPNGAGKSTTVKVMSGILTPEKGECKILGRIPWKERTEHVSKIGVVFGQRSQLWWDVPVKDSFNLIKDIYNVSTEQYEKRLTELVETLDVSSLLQTPVRQLSLGQRMRCEIVAALIHSPSILFLDEPTIGLDAVSKLALREFLKKENREKGVTMILTTHDMDDIEALCERVMVIGHGKLLFNGNLEKLKNQFAPLRRIRATLSKNITELDISYAEQINFEGNTCTVMFDPSKIAAHEMIANLSAQLIKKDILLKDIFITEQDIDEIIALMYREMRL